MGTRIGWACTTVQSQANLADATLSRSEGRRFGYTACERKTVRSHFNHLRREGTIGTFATPAPLLWPTLDEEVLRISYRQLWRRTLHSASLVCHNQYLPRFRQHR